MTDTLNIGLKGLNLGPVALLNLADLPHVAQSPFHNSLQLHHQDAKLHLHHRAAPQKLQRDQNYETELGVVLAASAIVFVGPLASAPKEMTLLLLVQKALNGVDEVPEPELVLIAPSRDGNSDMARPVDAAQQKVLLDAVQDQQIEFAPVADDQTNSIDLVRTSLLTGAHQEVDLPLNGQALLDIEFELPLELSFDADGLFYFRDVMNGEADFLFSHQSDLRATTVEFSITDGEMFLLDDDEEFLEAFDGLREGGFTDFTIDLAGAEGFFSRLVVQLNEEAEKASLGIEVFFGAQVIVATNIAIHKSPEDDADNLIIDETSGLPDDDALPDMAPIDSGLFSDDGRFVDDQEVIDDFFGATPDLL